MRGGRSIWAGCAVVAALCAAPALAREALGVYSGWAAFRDDAPERRCFAVAEPVRRTRGGRWRAYLSIGHWPERGARAQVQVGLSRPKARGTPVVLAIGDRRFGLIAGGRHAWGASPRADAAIVAALRAGTSASIEARGRDGSAFVDAYALRGAASAIDAAALGCRPR